jgi:hypothetical protein
MSTVIFKRTDDTSSVPIVDGQLVFDETNYKIYMDNGSTRYQYGGDTDLISNPSSATVTNAFNASSSLNLFLQKSTVVDTKANALAVTQNYIPLGCLAFKETIGTSNYSTLGDGSISGALLALRGNISTGTLLTGNTSLTISVPTLTANSFIDYYTSVYKAIPTDAVVNYNSKTITLSFDSQDVDVTVKVVIKNV